MADAASRSAASFAASPSSPSGDVAGAVGSAAAAAAEDAAAPNCAVRLRTCCVRLAMHSSRALACGRERQSVGQVARGPSLGTVTSVGHEISLTSAEGHPARRNATTTLARLRWTVLPSTGKAERISREGCLALASSPRWASKLEENQWTGRGDGKIPDGRPR